MKRSADIKRGTPPRRRVGLRTRSKKMAARYVERRQFVERVLASRRRCEVAVEGLCIGRATTLHEVLTRARGGPIVPSEGLDPRDVLAACAPCHSFVHDHRAWAHSVGLLRFSWESR